MISYRTYSPPHHDGTTTTMTSLPPAMTQNLLRLRQACCHPQVGSHGMRVLDEGGHHRRSGMPLTMDEVLDEMLKDVRQ